MNRTVFAILPFLALIIFCAPLITKGFPQGHDWQFEIVRIAEYSHALADGQYPPYWGGNLYGGYGSPIFLFYAPLFVLTASLFASLSNSFATGGAAALVFYHIAAAIGVWIMMRAALPENTRINLAAARAAVYFFILNPYLTGNALLRNANAEYTALCLAPLPLAGLFLAGSRPRPGFILLSAGLALTILGHNLTALVIMAMILSGALFLYLPARSVKLWGTLISATALGLALAAFFWLPAFLMKSQVRTDLLVTGKFDFHNQFQKVTTFFGYEQFYASGLITPVLLIISAIICWRARNQGFAARRLCLFGLCAALFLLFLQTRASVFLWENIPLLPFFQFPWRMMGPLALMATILAGLSFAVLFRGKTDAIIMAGEITFFILCLANALPLLQDYKPLDPAVSKQLSQALSEKAIRKDLHTATVLDEYLPKQAQPYSWRFDRPASGPLIGTIPPVQARTELDSGTKIILAVDSRDGSRLKIARWFLPEWRCTVNETACEVQPNTSGTLELQAPGGHIQIRLELPPPLLRKIGIWISLAGLLIWLMVAGWRPSWAKTA